MLVNNFIITCHMPSFLLCGRWNGREVVPVDSQVHYCSILYCASCAAGEDFQQHRQRPQDLHKLRHQIPGTPEALGL